jgi:hypothetical protein
MSKRRIRRSIEPTFPYGKSVVISCGLLVVIMLVLAALADPKSGDIRRPILAWSILGALPVGIAGIVYVESKLRTKSQQNSLQQLNHSIGMKRQGAEKGRTGRDAYQQAKAKSSTDLGVCRESVVRRFLKTGVSGRC